MAVACRLLHLIFISIKKRMAHGVALAADD
jgi:hypothetical protein